MCLISFNLHHLTLKSNAPVKKHFLCTFLFLTSVLVQAQIFDKAVFTHKTNQKTRTLKAGDHLTVTYVDQGKRKKTEGNLERVQDGVLYLFYQEGIPLENVQKVRSGNQRLSKVVALGFKIGIFLIVVGFLAALLFLFTYGAPAAVLGGIGMFMICIAFIMQAIGIQQIPDAGTAWKVETVVKAAPVQIP
jgi:hypothetical protein